MLSEAVRLRQPPPASIPEPGILFLVGTGILGMGKIVKRRFR